MRISVSQDQWRRAILLFLPLAFAIVVATYSWRLNVQLATDHAQVTRSYAITASLEALMSRTTDGETGERGFLITGNETYLEPYVLFTSTIENIYTNLVALTADDAIQRPQIVLLRTLLDARKQELARIIQLRRDSGFDVARSSVSFDRGKDIHDRIRENTQHPGMGYDSSTRCEYSQGDAAFDGGDGPGSPGRRDAGVRHLSGRLAGQYKNQRGGGRESNCRD